MRYEKLPVSTELASLVKCYFVWEGESTLPLDVQSPPNCYGAMVFNYADPYSAYQHTREIQSVPQAFVCQLFTSNYHLVLKGKIGMIGIVFRASGIYNLFGATMPNLINSRMPLSLLLGLEANHLLRDIGHQSSDDDRKDILERFLLNRLETAKSRQTIIDEAIEYIDEKRGCISVEQVADHLKISRRYLEKKFLEKVGVSPKFYARIKRFASLSIRIPYDEKIDWQQLIFEYGFHDQSHLVKEFMEFNQMNPSNYHQLNQEMAKYLKKN